MSFDVPTLAAVAAGVASWTLFHKRTIRGDYALLVHLLLFALSCLYSNTLSLSRSPTPPGLLAATVTLPATYLFTLLLITLSYRASPWHPLAHIPGPGVAKYTSLWLSYISFTGRRYIILDRLHAQYGPFLRIGPYHVSVNSPRAASIYLSMEKSESYRFPGHRGGIALFFKQDDPQDHLHRKRKWSPLFSPTGVAALIPQFERRTWEMVHCLERRQKESKDGFVDLAETMYHWAHDFMGDMVFGGCNKFELMKNGDPLNMVTTSKVATAMLDSIGQSPWLMDILWHVPVTKRMHLLEQTAAQMMRTRMKTLDLPYFRDLASYLIENGLSQKELETDAIVAIVGGSDNTSITVSLAIYFLLSHRRYYHKLRKELDDAFPNPEGSLPMTVLASLPFLDGVINETLRLASPYFLPRVVPAGGAHIDGKYLPEGTVVALAAHSQQTSPENFFPSPQEFHPERWQPEGLGPHTKTNKAILASFSFGPHFCIGKNFAYQQMRYALARLILMFDMDLPEDFNTAEFRARILNMRTMFLEKPLRVKLMRRPGMVSSLESAVKVD